MKTPNYLLEMTTEKHQGLQEAKGAEDHRDQRKREAIRHSNRHHLGIHHRPGWPACFCSHLGHVRTWTGTQRLLLHQTKSINQHISLRSPTNTLSSVFGAFFLQAHLTVACVCLESYRLCLHRVIQKRAYERTPAKS